MADDRSTPAWAGQPEPRPRRIPVRSVYPRVGGATHPAVFMWLKCRGLPPRGRGNRAMTLEITLPVRSTPAWAGQPLT